MKPAPTLMDEVYRMACRNKPNPGWKDNVTIRRALEKAKRFVVDEPMAGFMAELSNAAFIKAVETKPTRIPGYIKAEAANPLAHRIADSIRVQARLPYEAIWIEYPLRAYQKRAHEIRGDVDLSIDPDEIPWREGWLIQQHPNIDTAYLLHIWTQAAPGEDSPDGYDLWTFPFAFGWTADDSPLPWWKSVVMRGKTTGSSLIVGIEGYDRENVNCVRSPLIHDPSTEPKMLYGYNSLLNEWGGVVRRVWALLATINDIPTTIGTVRQTKGFLARGRIRKFLDHSTITLNIPARKDTKVLARQLIAIAHRRRHPVRAHWRDDWRHPPDPRCQHLYEIIDDAADRIECSRCGGRQTYIHRHERGDATLGWVGHSYNITHKEHQDG